MSLAPLKQGKVIGRYVREVGSFTGDGTPETLPMSGTVTFTPEAPELLVATASPIATTVFPDPVVAFLDSDGYLSLLDGTRGVKLDIASADTNPAIWNWRATFALTAGGRTVTKASFVFALTEFTISGTEINLTTVSPVPGVTPVGIIQGPAGVPLRVRGQVANYAALTALTGPFSINDAYVVASPVPALLYIYGATGFPTSGNGVAWQGVEGPTGAIDDAITDGVTVRAPSQNAVFDALALKAPLPPTPTAVKTAAYTAAAGDLVLADATSAGFTITMPSAPADKTVVQVERLDSTANTLTLAAGGSAKFYTSTGPTTLTVPMQYSYARLQYQATGALWHVQRSTPKSSLDAAYVAKSGDTMTGNLTLAPASGGISEIFNVPVAQRAGFIFRRGGLDRFQLHSSEDAESGSNNGTFLDLWWCNDAGVAQGLVFRVYRTDGRFGFFQSPDVPDVASWSDGYNAANTHWVNDRIGRPVSIARQALSSTSATYIGGKTIAAGELATSAHYRIVLSLAKTATTMNTTINVRYGSTGTTADTSLAQLALTGGFNADTAVVTIEVGVDTINAATGTMTATLSAVSGAGSGFNNQLTGTANGQVATLDTTAARTLSVSVTASTASVVTVLSGTIQKIVA